MRIAATLAAAAAAALAAGLVACGDSASPGASISQDLRSGQALSRADGGDEQVV